MRFFENEEKHNERDRFYARANELRRSLEAYELKRLAEAIEVVETHKSADKDLPPPPPYAPPRKADVRNIRKAVCTLANALKKLSDTVDTLSEAFKRAWGHVKGNITTTVYGRASYTNEEMKKLGCPAVLEIRREHCGIFGKEIESKSVAVWVSINGERAYRLGYIATGLARYVAKLLDNGVKLTAEWLGTTGGTLHNPNVGASVDIKF